MSPWYRTGLSDKCTEELKWAYELLSSRLTQREQDFYRAQFSAIAAEEFRRDPDMSNLRDPIIALVAVIIERRKKDEAAVDPESHNGKGGHHRGRVLGVDRTDERKRSRRGIRKDEH